MEFSGLCSDLGDFTGKIVGVKLCRAPRDTIQEPTPHCLDQRS